MGNTSVGETVSEVMLIVKWLKNKYNLDLWLKGYSGAGTVSIVAAAIDKNINDLSK